MTQPATDAQLKQANRNQNFTNTTMGSGQCGLMAGEVAIFPVRYAVDESPKKGSAQGPNPLPKDWSDKPAELKTRSYTLRQLRDGWLYVWDSVDKTFHEYQVKGEQFTRHKWTDSQLNQDVRNNPGETHSYLLYPRRNQLRIAYSPVQWTWRMCELMRNSKTEQTQWMRKVDLAGFCKSAKVGHGGPIAELGKSVSDILVAGKSAPTFTSTLLPTRAPETGGPFKPAFEEALVRGKVPEQDTALFIALDDPLAIVDDLNMNLIGRLMEQSQFEQLHQHDLQSAFAVQNLCGFDAETFIPSTIKDPIQRQAYTDDLYKLLKNHEQIQHGKDLVDGAFEGLVETGAAPNNNAAESVFKAKWKNLPNREKWKRALDEWNSKRYWREDVRFDEVLKYISKTTIEALKLQNHCRNSEEDLIVWLDKLSPNAEAIYHDTCNEKQSSKLLEIAHAVYTSLGNGEKGQKWLCKQAKEPSKLFGTALFNFHPELSSAIRKVSKNFSTTGKLDDSGEQGDGSSPSLDPTTSGDATNVATRTGELKAILDLDAVKNSKTYSAMSSSAKQAMATLIKVANNSAKDAWHGLASFLLPALQGETTMALVASQALFSTEISSNTQLTYVPTYKNENRTWQQSASTISKQLKAQQGVLNRPGTHYDKRSAAISVEKLTKELDELILTQPNKMVAKVNGSTRLSAGIPKIQGWLSDLGQAELKSQLRLKTNGSSEYLNRSKAWVNQNLGNSLPVLLVGLNLWNFANSVKQAKSDGILTKDELRTIGSNAAYAANAIVGLWVGPAWSRASGLSAEIGQKTRSLAQASQKTWLREAKNAGLAKDAAKQAAANEFATLSRGLIRRTMTWAALGAIATGLEAWQLSSEIGNATSKEEKALLSIKLGIVTGMSVLAVTQTVGIYLGHWFAFSWAMSSPIIVLIAVLGVAYLMISMAANRFKREGLRLWLYNCTWGRSTKPEWIGDEGQPKQMTALAEILQRPTVIGRALYYGGGSTPRKWLGFWVQFQLPNSLGGKKATLQPGMIEQHIFSKDTLKTVDTGFYKKLLNGCWIDPKQLGVLPAAPGDSQKTPADFIYSKSDTIRIWQVWIDTSIDSPVLEMEVLYPSGVLQREGGRGYVFRLDLQRTTSEGDRKNNVLNGELSEDSVLKKKSTQSLTLLVPDSQRE